MPASIAFDPQRVSPPNLADPTADAPNLPVGNPYHISRTRVGEVFGKAGTYLTAHDPPTWRVSSGPLLELVRFRAAVDPGPGSPIAAGGWIAASAPCGL